MLGKSHPILKYAFEFQIWSHYCAKEGINMVMIYYERVKVGLKKWR